MAIKWTATGFPTVSGGFINLTEGQSITSVDQNIEDDLLLEFEYEAIKTPSTEQITLEVQLDFVDGGSNALKIRRYDSQGGASRYDILWNDVSQGTTTITSKTDKIQVSRTGTQVVIGSFVYRELGIIAAGSSDPLKTITFSVAASTQVLTAVEYINVYDTIVQVWDFAPDTYESIPIFPFVHNWVREVNIDTMRFGTRIQFGRGRLVEVDSSRPQEGFAMKSLFNRQEAFEFLRWFDYTRGRLVPFWLANPQNLWEIVSIGGSSITVKGYGLEPEDISDFFLYVKAIGDENIMAITSVIAGGDNLVINSDQVPVGLVGDFLQPVHLVRFGRDSIREVWTNRSVCEIAFDLMELLEPARDIPSQIWGGAPNDPTTSFVFGGFPSTVTEDVYFGGLPDGTS